MNCYPTIGRSALLIGCAALALGTATAEAQTPAAAAAGAAAGGGASGLLLGGLALAGLAAMAAGGGGGGGGGSSRSSGSSDGPSSSFWRGGSGTPLRFGLDDEMPSGAPDDFETREYRANYSLGMIGASFRYAAGATGRGTLGAIFDSGADVRHRELSFGINTDASYSYYTGTNDVRDFTGHGTAVAGIIAAEKDDSGMHGVAFESSLMVLQAFGRTDKALRLSATAAWADAQRRAAAAGATAINHSWSLYDSYAGRSYRISDFDGRSDFGAFLGRDTVAALNDGREGDLITVFATGNESFSEPSAVSAAPVLLTEMQPYWIAVTAVNPHGEIAGYANHCGSAMDFCLAAPGNGIVAPDSRDAGAGTNGYQTVTGTSFAAPHVTGATLLLKSQFPELTAPEIQRILFDTARDLGAAGTDPIYGRGLLDLENAVRPHGELKVQMAGSVGQATERADDSFIAASGAFAPVLAAALESRHLMVTDGYDRGYSADMGDFVMAEAPHARAASRVEGFALSRPGAVTIDGGGQSLRVARAIDPAADGGTWADPEAFAVPYAAFLDDGTFVRHEAELASGVSLHVTAASDTRGVGGAFLSSGLTFGNGPAELSVEVGQLEERGAVLGTGFGGGFGAGTEASTAFARVGGRLALGSGVALHASASWGSTDFAQSGLVSGGRGIESSALGLGVSADGVLGGRLSLGLSRPLTVSGGEIDLDVPVAISAAEGGVRTDRVLRQQATVDLDWDDEPLDLQIGHSFELGAARVALGGLYRVSGPGEGALSASVGLSLSF